MSATGLYCKRQNDGQGKDRILPRTQIFEYRDPPDEGSSKSVDFRLTYKGRLPAEGSAGGRTKDKQLLRKHFHKQLRELWKQHPGLREQAEAWFIFSEPGVTFPPGGRTVTLATQGQPGAKNWIDHIADDYQRCGGRFVPLIKEDCGLTCSLEILFLRRGNPGDLFASGGDIDNRVKVLFDGLKIPKTTEELGGLPLEDDENPFFCLLEDDSLISSISITTDRLLTPLDPGESVKDVDLVIHVTVNNSSALFAGGRLI
jgi:hypothetical protein